MTKKIKSLLKSLTKGFHKVRCQAIILVVYFKIWEDAIFLDKAIIIWQKAKKGFLYDVTKIPKVHLLIITNTAMDIFLIEAKKACFMAC